MRDGRARGRAVAAVAGALVAMGGLAGCSGAVPGDPVPAYERSWRPTERQARVALDLGYTQDDVDAMLAGGSRADDYERVMYADALLGHLEGRYGLSFRVRGVHAPEWFDRTWWVRAVVDGGDYDGEEVTCTWVWRDAQTHRALDEPYYLDNVVPALRGGELESWLGRVVEEELGEYGVAWEAYATTTEVHGICDMESSAQEMSEEVRSTVYVSFPPWCGLTRDEYDAALARLAARYLAEAPNSRVAVSAYMITVMPEGLESPEGFDARAARAALQAEGETYEWHVEGGVAGWGASDAD